VPDRDRDDVTNDLFVRVFQRFDMLDRSRSPKPWLFAFAVRVAADYRKLARHRVEKLVDQEHDVASGALHADDALVQEERRRLVLDALETLDLEKRAVVILHDLDETPIPEVARALGVAEGTAYSRLRAGRAELTSALRRAQTRAAAQRKQA
jgi:RNA polymerase sigma-70 factor (ECF subfamily)